MEPNQYRYMFEAEDRHWWYVANQERFLDLLKRHRLIRPGMKVLDAGCGTGRWLQVLTSAAPIEETGIDYSPLAIEMAKTRGPLHLEHGDLKTYPFPDSSFDLITSFDVICNINIEDEKMVQHFHHLLKDEGHLLMSLPAFKFLMGKHDRLVHQNKRYRLKTVKTMVNDNGFEIVKITYVMSLLFPFALVKRLAEKMAGDRKKEHNEVKVPGAFINKLFLSIARLENILIRHLPLPPGLSVMVLAKKTKAIL